MSAKLILTLIAALCVILGVVWMLQGWNVLPGSFMTGHREWIRNGAILAAVGVFLFWAARRK